MVTFNFSLYTLLGTYVILSFAFAMRSVSLMMGPSGLGAVLDRYTFIIETFAGPAGSVGTEGLPEGLPEGLDVLDVSLDVPQPERTADAVRTILSDKPHAL
ncbi:hypothetical protein D3C73_1214070 [compost metagenome]